MGDKMKGNKFEIIIGYRWKGGFADQHYRKIKL